MNYAPRQNADYDRAAGKHSDALADFQTLSAEFLAMKTATPIQRDTLAQRIDLAMQRVVSAERRLQNAYQGGR